MQSSETEATSTATSGNGLQKQVKKAMLAAALSTVFGVPLLDPTSSNPVSHVLVPPAMADFRAQQKRTYFRFVPKLIQGKDFYKTELKTAIDKEDWKVVNKMFEEYVTKKNNAGVVLTDTYANEFFYRPMTLFAGTFAEKGTSEKTAAMTEQLDLFKESMTDLRYSCEDKPGKFFFQGPEKAPTGRDRKKIALAAFEKGKTALNTYIKLGNDGLMLELNKIETI
jgi:hypothetical protein